jgi:hypothetical protein
LSFLSLDFSFQPFPVDLLGLVKGHALTAAAEEEKNLLTFPSKTKTTLQPFSTTIFALYKMLKC